MECAIYAPLLHHVNFGNSVPACKAHLAVTVFFNGSIYSLLKF